MKFSVTYKNQSVTIEVLSRVSNIYAVEIPGEPVFFITMTPNTDSGRSWTPIPSGNESRAKEIGALIEAHQKQNPS